jgi:hypothetical protein
MEERDARTRGDKVLLGPPCAAAQLQVRSRPGGRKVTGIIKLNIERRALGDLGTLRRLRGQL